jgi:hypothetical protein
MIAQYKLQNKMLINEMLIAAAGTQMWYNTFLDPYPRTHHIGLIIPYEESRCLDFEAELEGSLP